MVGVGHPEPSTPFLHFTSSDQSVLLVSAQLIDTIHYGLIHNICSLEMMFQPVVIVFQADAKAFQLFSEVLIQD